MLLKKIRIFTTLILLTSTIIFVPLFSVLLAHATSIFLVVLLICLLMALIQRAWFDVILSAAFAASIIISIQTMGDIKQTTRLLATFGLMAYLCLNLLLLIGPWTRFFPKTVWLYKYRRHLGVCIFLLALAHASLIFSTYFSYSASLAFSYSVPFLGFTALFIMAALAITSYDKIQKRVSINQWEIIHTLLLCVYTIALAFYFTNAGSELSISLRLFFVGLLVYWILISPLALPARLLKFVNGWKQLHLLLYVAYFSVLIHVWMARVSSEVLYKKIGFVSLTVLVVGSHLIGWMYFWIQRSKERKNQKAQKQKEMNGKMFTQIGKSADFQEQIGQKVLIDDKDIAVFRYQGMMYAIENRCPHQGGSLSAGIIKDGFVECPLHGYQFGIKDGKGPAEYGDAVNSYSIQELDGYVYLCDEAATEVKSSCQNCHC